MAKNVSKEAQLELESIDKNRKTEVLVPRTNKKYKIGWLRPDTTDRISRMILNNEISDELAVAPEPKKMAEFMSKKIPVAAKLASVVILNNFWKNTFYGWLHWRWLYYVKQYDFDQLSAIVIAGKKKMDAGGYYVIMALSASMMDTMRTMTKKEASEYLAELSSAISQPSEKSTLGL